MTDLIDPNRVRFGPYEVDLHTHEIWKFGTRMKLVGQPFEILAVLVTRAGELVMRDELRERLWPAETFVDFNHGLNAAMNKLRDLLSDSADDPKYIETLPRRGYRFIAKVERGGSAVAKSAVLAAVPESVPVSPEISTVAAQEVPEHKLDQGLPRTFIGVLAGAVLLMIFVVIFAIFAPRKEPPAMAFSYGMRGSQRTVVDGGKNEGPQFSPDGKKLVFMSDRGAGKNLWVSNTDGTDARQITNIGDTGTPRWSPDGRSIAFDSHVRKYSAILIVDAHGGDPRLTVVGDANNSVPSWSHDGKTLYFASDRTGQYEVWKLDLSSGKQEQITKNSGFAPLESADGKTIYYAKTQFQNPGVWSVPAAGGDETLVSTSIRPGTWANWSLADGEIYFVEEGPGNVAMLSAFELKTQRMRQITMLGRFPFWLAVDKDGSRAAFDRADSEDATSIVELEDFR